MISSIQYFFKFIFAVHPRAQEKFDTIELIYLQQIDQLASVASESFYNAMGGWSRKRGDENLPH